MREFFGYLPTGKQTWLYTISCGSITAHILDFGATLVRLYVPDSAGNTADIVLGFDDCNGYRYSTAYFGATIGRNANRIGNASFTLNNKTLRLAANENGNSLHSGPDSFAFRLWTVKNWESSKITFRLHSPDSDQGFPGNTDIQVTYELTPNNSLIITYDALSDQDTVLNLTNHAYFNLAGHDKPEKAMAQILTMPAHFFCSADPNGIPTGILQNVDHSPMDFRIPKPIGRDIEKNFDALIFQHGYDHTFEVSVNPCAILHDPSSGRTMSISTDCPGIHVYSGNYLANEKGKNGAVYCKHAGIAFETQFYPDAVHHPEWKQPIISAHAPYHSVTEYHFS